VSDHGPVSGRTRVFGVGWAKTGTTTLAECLRILGYRHLQGPRLDLVELLEGDDPEALLAVVEPYESAEDWPWPLLFRELDARFPDSRFVLTTREPASWLRSYRNMVARQQPDPDLDATRRVLYGLPFPDVTDEQLLDRVAQHDHAVRAWFADRPGSLLEVDWATGDGWDELCAFLGEPRPALAFPHANRGEYTSAGRRLVRRGRRSLVRRLGR
jgi:hypothetical protein